MSYGIYNNLQSSYKWHSYDGSEEQYLEGEENDGRIGLSNIGNTCFMNSALQCILHNDLLKQFFLQANVNSEINEKNPLGTKGSLFKEISKLFKQYYRTKNFKITPLSFKYELGNNNPIFDGYQQHDSQEFWSYVIDMIHEDSNRILNKPYVENIEGTGKEHDYELARKSWINYLKRNYSIVTENFTGQYKSRVDCVTEGCNNTSITFEPFIIISLPIPNVQTQEFDILTSPADEMNFYKEITFVAKSSRNFIDIKLGEIKEKLAVNLNKNPENFKIGHFNMRNFGENYEDTDSLSKVCDKKGIDFGKKLSLILTELTENDMKFVGDRQTVTVYFKTNYEIYDMNENDNRRNMYDFRVSSRDYNEVPVFIKFFYLNPQSTIRDLYISVLRKLYYTTSLCENKDDRSETQADFERIWHKIENESPENRFFYIKYNDALLSRNLLDCTLENELNVKGGRLDLSVFIRDSSKTPIKTNLSHRISYEYFKYDYNNKKIEFVSEMGLILEKDITLEKLLKKFENTEILDKNNLWRCSKCKQEVAAKKSMLVYKAPNYLTIHFKKNKSYHNKNPLVSFPNILDLEPFLTSKTKIEDYDIKLLEFMSPVDIAIYQNAGKNPIIQEPPGTGTSMEYKLYGVVNHYGSQNFGHYTSVCEVNGSWIEFNDSSISYTDKERLVSDEAYILFYKRI